MFPLYALRSVFSSIIGFISDINHNFKMKKSVFTKILYFIVRASFPVVIHHLFAHLLHFRDFSSSKAIPTTGLLFFSENILISTEFL